jgi:SAM-dependent methyltransferase
VTSKDDQYARQAEGWTERAYADVGAYLAHRAELIQSLGRPLGTGDTVLDLACGDGGLGDAPLARGLRYRGLDATSEMVESARRRLAGRAEVELGDLNDYVPAEPVAATTVFRAIYYARDRAAFFRHVAAYTDKKLVFDLNPRQYRIDDVVADLRGAGFSSIALRPFLVPQTVSLPGPLLAAAKAVERSGPIARLALRVRFTYLVAASR